jgi:hypothetical protein
MGSFKETRQWVDEKCSTDESTRAEPV